MTVAVVAAIIFRAGRILICQRRATDTLGLKWEFPGGKVDAGETQPEALARELQEELDVAARVGPLVYETTFTYGSPGQTIQLSFFRVTIAPDALLRNLAFEKIQWEIPQELQRYDFLPADRELVAQIATRTIGA